MFARATRPLLRRTLHTASRRPASTSNIVALSLGATAVTASYVTWRLNSSSQRVALDAPPASKVGQTKTSTRQAPTNTTSSPDEVESSAKPPSDESKLTGNGDAASESEPQQSSGANQGAYNPETGEINWDCPCLGGMAHGPCGMEFREAFSCFVHSEDEPKGINCVEKFKAMQDCFRAHPEVYADEIMDDDDDEPNPDNAADSSTEKTPPTDTAVDSEVVTAQS